MIEVTDEFCPWNAGRWRIARGGRERTKAEPDLACDVASLGCVYLGGFTFAQLERAMRMKELRRVRLHAPMRCSTAIARRGVLSYSSA